MTVDMVGDIMQDMFRTLTYLALPSLLAALTVGVVISVFQTVTSIQEQTLVFVPKMLAVMIALVVTFSWMMSIVIEYTTELFQSIPQVIQ